MSISGVRLSIDAAIGGFVYRAFREQNSIVLHCQPHALKLMHAYTHTTHTYLQAQTKGLENHINKSNNKISTWSINNLPAQESMVHMTYKECFSSECVWLHIYISPRHFIHKA